MAAPMNTTAIASTSSNTTVVTQATLGEGAYGRVTLVSTVNGRFARKTFLHQKDCQYELEVYRAVVGTVDRLGANYLGVANLSIPLFGNSDQKYLDFPPADMDLHTLAFDPYEPKCSRLDTAESVFTIIHGALAGLAFLHDHVNLTHCDVKPANLLLHADGHLAICDFGMAVPRTDKAVLHIGTFGYMSPEAWRAPKEVGHSMDMFALGVALFEVFEGELPYVPTDDLYVLNTAWN